MVMPSTPRKPRSRRSPSNAVIFVPMMSASRSFLWKSGLDGDHRAHPIVHCSHSQFGTRRKALETMWSSRVNMQLNRNIRQSELLPIGNGFISEYV